MNLHEEASRLYAEMLYCYENWHKDGVDSAAYRARFINAAVDLSSLNMPNPFTGALFEPEAAKTPLEGKHVTGFFSKLFNK